MSDLPTLQDVAYFAIGIKQDVENKVRCRYGNKQTNKAELTAIEHLTDSSAAAFSALPGYHQIHHPQSEH
jgi:hypothetical protein